MKTLTITEAKKNLGKWLKAAVDGDDVAIINGATCVALRPVQIEAPITRGENTAPVATSLKNFTNASRWKLSGCGERVV